jgi:hypothetical protein
MLFSGDPGPIVINLRSGTRRGIIATLAAAAAAVDAHLIPNGNGAPDPALGSERRMFFGKLDSNCVAASNPDDVHMGRRRHSADGPDNVAND